MKIIHYINQFFAGIGGEDKADQAPFIRSELIGPAVALNAMVAPNGGAVTHTIVCGDNFMGSRTEEAVETILGFLRDKEFDLTAAALMACCLVIGPTREILCNLVEGLGQYIQTFPASALETGAFSGQERWYSTWTIFYWAWWIAWAPFIGGFIARISKGRTIRSFIGGVLFLPSSASLLWFSVFGSMGIHAGREMGVDAAAELVADAAGTLFAVLQYYPMATLLSVVFLVLLCTFFITSSNSATFVLGMLSSGGDLNPPLKRKLVWGVLQTVLALVLLVCTANGLNMLQTISIVAAFPFTFILLCAIVSVLRALRADPAAKGR